MVCELKIEFYAFCLVFGINSGQYRNVKFIYRFLINMINKSDSFCLWQTIEEKIVDCHIIQTFNTYDYNSVIIGLGSHRNTTQHNRLELQSDTHTHFQFFFFFFAFASFSDWERFFHYSLKFCFFFRRLACEHHVNSDVVACAPSFRVSYEFKNSQTNENHPIFHLKFILHRIVCACVWSDGFCC